MNTTSAELQSQSTDVWPWVSLLLIATALYLIIALITEHFRRRRARRSYEKALINWRLRANDFDNLLPPPPRHLERTFL